MIKLLTDKEALLHHHSTIWIKTSESGAVDVITAERPQQSSEDVYSKLKVRYEHREFESTLLKCANSGLSVEAFSNDPSVATMDRHRIKIIAYDHLAIKDLEAS